MFISSPSSSASTSGDAGEAVVRGLQGWGEARREGGGRQRGEEEGPRGCSIGKVHFRWTKRFSKEVIIFIAYAMLWDESFEWIEISAYLEVRQKLAPLACQKRLKTLRRLKSDCETCQSNGRRHFPTSLLTLTKRCQRTLDVPRMTKKGCQKANPVIQTSQNPIILAEGFPSEKG